MNSRISNRDATLHFNSVSERIAADSRGLRSVSSSPSNLLIPYSVPNALAPSYSCGIPMLDVHHGHEGPHPRLHRRHMAKLETSPGTFPLEPREPDGTLVGICTFPFSCCCNPRASSLRDLVLLSIYNMAASQRRLEKMVAHLNPQTNSLSLQETASQELRDDDVVIVRYSCVICPCCCRFPVFMLSVSSFCRCGGTFAFGFVFFCVLT